MEEEKKKLKLKSPEEVFDNIKKYFNSGRIKIFILTFVLGIITHFLLLSNFIFSQDGLLHILHYSSGGYEASLGRWGIDFFDSLRFDIAIPFLTTLISIVIMGIISNLLIDIFEIKNKIFKFFTLLSLVLSPCLCMTLLYVYTADVYFYSMFFSVLTVYAFYKMENKVLGNVIGIISFIITLATYQSYVGITIGLILMISIKRLIIEKDSSLKVIKDIFFRALTLLVAVVIYFFITVILLNIWNLEMSTYGGVNEISLGTIFGSIITSIKNAYIGFIKYFFADGIILNRTYKREKLYLIFFAISFITINLLFKEKYEKEDKKKEVLCRFGIAILFILFLPLALNIVLIMAPGNELYYLTSTQMLLVIPFILSIFELIKNNSILKTTLSWGFVIILTIIMITYFISICVTYQTAELTYNQARSVANRIIDRMEEYPGYRSGMNKLFAGVIDDLNFPKTLDIYNFAVTNSLKGSIFHGTYMGQEGTWRNFINTFCGTDISFCKDYEYYTIINSEEFKQMDIFPGENSVRMINDVMVVKFTDTPSLPPMSESLIEHGISY